MHSLWDIRHSIPIGNTQTWVLLYLFKRQPIGTDVETTPALCESDEPGNGHGPLDHARKRLSDLYVFNIARVTTPNPLLFVGLPYFGKSTRRQLICVIALETVVFGANFTCRIAFGSKAPRVAACNKFVAISEEIHVIDLLDRAASEFRLVWD